MTIPDSIEDLAQLIYASKRLLTIPSPVGVKIAAVHNWRLSASGMVRAGADIIVLDGLRAPLALHPRLFVIMWAYLLS